MPGTMAISEFLQFPNAVPARRSIDNSIGPSIAFGPFRLFPVQRLLMESNRPVHLGSRAFDILLVLLKPPGVLRANEELIARVLAQNVCRACQSCRSYFSFAASARRASSGKSLHRQHSGTRLPFRCAGHAPRHPDIRIADARAEAADRLHITGRAHRSLRRAVAAAPRVR